MREREGEFAGAGGARLFYRMAAPVESAKGVVIAVHGLGDHSGGLRNLLTALVENGYLAYALDLRGHGKSPGKRGFIRTWEEFQGDLHSFRERVVSETPSLPLFLAGHSLGGVICADYALSRGQGMSGLVLISPAISYEATFFEKCLIALLGAWKPDFAVQKKGNQEWLTQDSEIRARLASDPLRHDTATSGLGLGLMKAVGRLGKEVVSLRIPLLLQFGLEDRITPPAKLRDFYRSVGSADKRVFEYAGMRHRPFDDLRRELFAWDLLEWLDGHAIAR
ncbi:alpha/beta hydrolase [Cohnella caldifontis]|uniref:alpha/beta hydrolase n=1 Tax=Cohnella caldifontis TaxID=3027471 RepID=UPI0023EC9359|nr:alpha/beta hydrolase [Cohnella sp. YIM B05605]